MESPRVPLVIIPAAGYGLRVGAPESKEMLPGPDGRPLIGRVLDEANERKWPVIVITREEKLSLVSYIEEKRKTYHDLQIQLVGRTEEWPSTALLSRPFWRSWNLLALPDIDFSPKNTWDRMFTLIDDSLDLIVAQHKVDDLSHWGQLRPEGNGVVVAEKPKTSTDGWAWGIYMFSQDIGQRLLRAQLQSTLSGEEIFLENVRVRTLNLNSFVDLTREKP